jgi:hypothetical protein
MWWWQFNKEEPLQEDLVVYEKFTVMRQERQRMNEEKEKQKEERKSGLVRGTKYRIPDPV